MAFIANRNQQISLDDSTFCMSDRACKFLHKRWAEAFSKHIISKINEEPFTVLYSDNPASRSYTHVSIIIGMLILKYLFDHTDDDIIESMLFDVRYQYDLDTPRFTEQPISDRILSLFRERLYDYEQKTGIDLLKDEKKSLADAFVSMLGISGQTKRMDSLMVAASCKKMSRLELVCRCVRQTVKTMHATGETDRMDPQLLKYLDADDENENLYRTRSSEAGSKLISVHTDTQRLLDLAGDVYGEKSEYQQLRRMVDEQGKATEAGWQLCDKISHKSMQNPSDEYANYWKKADKKHKDYIGSFVETFDKNGAIITGMDYIHNKRSDMAFSRSVIEVESDRMEQPVIILANGAYGSDDLMALAEQKLNFNTKPLTGKTPDLVMRDDVIDENAQIYKTTCSRCSLRQHCGVKFQKDTGLVHTRGKTSRCAQLLKLMGEPEYMKLTRLRNADEGISSMLRRKYRVNEMPVRGYILSTLWYFQNVIAICEKSAEVAAEQAIFLLVANLHFIRLKIVHEARHWFLAGFFNAGFGHLNYNIKCKKEHVMLFTLYEVEYV